MFCLIFVCVFGLFLCWIRQTDGYDMRIATVDFRVSSSHLVVDWVSLTSPSVFPRLLFSLFILLYIFFVVYKSRRKWLQVRNNRPKVPHTKTREGGGSNERRRTGRMAGKFSVSIYLFFLLLFFFSERGKKIDRRVLLSSFLFFFLKLQMGLREKREREREKNRCQILWGEIKKRAGENSLYWRDSIAAVYRDWEAELGGTRAREPCVLSAIETAVKSLRVFFFS